MPAKFPLALDQIRALNPDLLVISGDILDYPMDELDDPITQEQGQQDYEFVAALLAELPFPVVLVHGNHDHPLLFAQSFDKYLGDQVVSGFRILTFRDDEGTNNVPVRVGVESARFTAALEDSASLPQIHIQHYLVWPERNEGYPHTYGKGAEMREAIIASGNVLLVLSGHYHHGVPLFLDKGVWFSTALAFTIAPHPFHIYDIDDEIISSRTFTLPT
jgi:predicted MPP superfamily phosphohydrolase